jgi:hypothetical protein
MVGTPQGEAASRAAAALYGRSALNPGYDEAMQSEQQSPGVTAAYNAMVAGKAGREVVDSAASAISNLPVVGDVMDYFNDYSNPITQVVHDVSQVAKEIPALDLGPVSNFISNVLDVKDALYVPLPFPSEGPIKQSLRGISEVASAIPKHYAMNKNVGLGEALSPLIPRFTTLGKKEQDFNQLAYDYLDSETRGNDALQFIANVLNIGGTALLGAGAGLGAGVGIAGALPATLGAIGTAAKAVMPVAGTIGAILSNLFTANWIRQGIEEGSEAIKEGQPDVIVNVPPNASTPSLEPDRSTLPPSTSPVSKPDLRTMDEKISDNMADIQNQRLNRKAVAGNEVRRDVQAKRGAKVTDVFIPEPDIIAVPDPLRDLWNTFAIAGVRGATQGAATSVVPPLTPSPQVTSSFSGHGGGSAPFYNTKRKKKKKKKKTRDNLRR